MSFSQVEVVEAFLFKMGENNIISIYCNENLFQRPSLLGKTTENSGLFFIDAGSKQPHFSGEKWTKRELGRVGRICQAEGNRTDVARAKPVRQ